MDKLMVTAAMLSVSLLAATTATAGSKRGPNYNKDCSAYGRGGVKSCFVQDGVQFCGPCKTHSLAVKPLKDPDADARLRVETPASSSTAKSVKPVN